MAAARCQGMDGVCDVSRNLGLCGSVPLQGTRLEQVSRAVHETAATSLCMRLLALFLQEAV